MSNTRNSTSKLESEGPSNIDVEHEVKTESEVDIVRTVFDKEPICRNKGIDCYDPLFWGPYLSERQWGTVREDYSSDDSCWTHTTYESAAKEAYVSGEDGLLGVSDKHGLLCASVALWNEVDPLMKERLFGLSGKEGNHGEDVKELYFYLDNTPDHSYMHALYKYPQNAFPYQALRQINERTLEVPEYELLETGLFDNNEYWDVHVEYAKPSNSHLICKYTVVNKASTDAKLHVTPQFYFRKTKPENTPVEPSFVHSGGMSVDASYIAGSFHITYYHSGNVTFNEILFTNNDSVEDEPDESVIAEGDKGVRMLPSSKSRVLDPSKSRVLDPSKSRVLDPSKSRVLDPSKSRVLDPSKSRVLDPSKSRMLDSSKSSVISAYVNKGIFAKKDAFHRRIIGQNINVLREEDGTKVGAWMVCNVPPSEKACIYWQIAPTELKLKGYNTIKKLDEAIRKQRQKADDFYLKIIPKSLTMDQINVCRQAYAGLMWSKQFYLYQGEDRINELYKLHGETYFYSVEGAKKFQWKHLDCEDILLVPDKWEFPWFASWDLAIQTALYASLDLEFAKKQITTLLSDRYIHPNGQIPSCEFNFSDVNPPLFAWAVWKIHQFEKPWHMDFIKSVYPRLLTNYQWWQRLDPAGSHLYGYGFMGLDNISLFDRSSLPRGIKGLKQADATGWMAQFALTMLQLTLEQCKYDLCLADMAIRFLGDFLSIAKAINVSCEYGGLWHEEDGFYYDMAHIGRQEIPIRVRSWTGIIPLMACAKISLKHAPEVKAFLLTCTKEFAPYVCKLANDEYFFTMVPYIKMKSVLHRVFSEKEFLSKYGIRSISKLYQTIPLNMEVKGNHYTMTFQPGESESNMFGGNSNWRGPIWLCLNYLLVECLERFSDLNQIFTHPLAMDYPSCLPYSKRKPFKEIVQDLCDRIISIFAPDHHSVRPVHNKQDMFFDPDWRDLIHFYEYFHSESGRGCGASHQTGWSALYVEFVKKSSFRRDIRRYSISNKWFGKMIPPR